jgi:plasmid stabilization system protein ParE
MRARYTDTALTDTDDILAPLATDNASAGAAVAATIEATIARLLSFPFIGAETNVAGVHMIVARPYSYLIFYSIAGDELVIRNIRHPARHRPPSDRS